MSDLNPDELKLVEQESLRDRDNLTNLYINNVNRILDGHRGVSDKQFNLNIALATISAAIIGIVIPLVSGSNNFFNAIFFWLAIIILGLSFIFNLVVSFGAIYYDRWTLDNQMPKLSTYFKNLLDSTTNIISKAKDKTLTSEDIKTHYENKNTYGQEFAKRDKLWIQSLLNIGYYIFISLFVLGLVFLTIAFIPSQNFHQQNKFNYDKKIL